MSRFKNQDHEYISGLTCPACEEDRLRAMPILNCSSRFCQAGANRVAYICIRCGTKEAFEGFFWKKNALKRGFELTEAGQHASPHREG